GRERGEQDTDASLLAPPLAGPGGAGHGSSTPRHRSMPLVAAAVMVRLPGSAAPAARSVSRTTQVTVTVTCPPGANLVVSTSTSRVVQVTRPSPRLAWAVASASCRAAVGLRARDAARAAAPA